jgi:4-hydroxy-tetrahydrodipicolinate reductase
MKTPVRVLLIGSAGRMGQAIADVASRDANIAVTGKCDQGDSIENAMKDCDVAIDFSQADAIDEVCRAALQYRTPLVIGTTGHSAEQRNAIEKTAQSLPIVFASNFSVGVNTLFALTGKTPYMLGPEFQVEVVETHHVMKKDAPSGTAKTLAEILKKARKTDEEIPIQSIREGDVVGEHTVIFAGPGEQLELIHRAKSRETFAKGALRAAQWIAGKPAGIYNMQDVLGL